jgi:hypothetical protein
MLYPGYVFSRSRGRILIENMDLEKVPFQLKIGIRVGNADFSREKVTFQRPYFPLEFDTDFLVIILPSVDRWKSTV